MGFNFKLFGARKKVGLTQKELAKRAGLDASVVSRIENGIYMPSESEKKAINQVLGTEVFG